MSRLADLIAELCPDGVEYRPLGEIADLQRGGGMPKKLFIDKGIPAIHYGHIFTKYGWCQWVVAMSWLNASVGVR